MSTTELIKATSTVQKHAESNDFGVVKEKGAGVSKGGNEFEISEECQVIGVTAAYEQGCDFDVATRDDKVTERDSKNMVEERDNSEEEGMEMEEAENENICVAEGLQNSKENGGEDKKEYDEDDAETKSMNTRKGKKKTLHAQGVYPLHSPKSYRGDSLYGRFCVGYS